MAIEESKKWIPVNKPVRTHVFIDKEGRKKQDQDIMITYQSIESIRINSELEGSGESVNAVADTDNKTQG